MSYNDWLDIDVLEDYLDGKLDASAMHKVEKLSLEDPFVAQALAGLSQSPKRTQSLSLLQKQLKARIEQKPIEKKMWAITSQRLSIGAAAAVLFIAVSVLFWMKGEKRQQMLANQKAKQIEVNLAPQIAITKEEVKSDASLDAEKDKVSVAKTPSVKPTDKRIKTIIENAPAVVINPNKEVVSVSPVVAGAARQSAAQSNTLEEVTIVSAKKESKSRSVAMSMTTIASDELTTNYLTGKVVDRKSGLPIEGASIRLEGTVTPSITDKNGEFNIAIQDRQIKKITVGRTGYNDKTADIKTNQKINVVLEESVGITDVVITNLAINQPVGGWESYQNYIKTNNKFTKNSSANSEVELKFNIRSDGTLSGIKVIKSAEKALDREAIRLAKEGPKWIYDATTTNLGRLKIQF